MKVFVHTLFLLFVFSLTFGQPSGLSNRSFSSKFAYVDSLRDIEKNMSAANFLPILEQAEKWVARNKDIELETELKLLRIKFDLNRKATTPDINELAYADLLAVAQEHDLKFLEADICQQWGDFYGETGRQYHGFERFLAAYTIYSEFSTKDFPPKEHYLFALGSTYYRYGDNENAIKYIKQAISVPDFNLRKSYTEFNSIGLSYRNMGKYDSALWYFGEMQRVATANKDSEWSGIVSGNIGITYYYQHRFDLAKPLIEKDIAASMRHHVVKNAVGSMLILGSLYFQEQEYAKAEQVVSNALVLSQQKGFWDDYVMKEKLFTQLFKIYAAKGNPVLATQYADSALVAKDSNNERNNALKFAKSQEKMDLIQRGLAEKQLQNQRKINFFLGTVSVLLLIIGILAYMSQRVTAGLNKQIISQKQELEKLNDVKDRIFSVISHDMRAPINSLIAFTHLLEGGKIGPEKMAAYADSLKNSLRYTSGLMENLLSWARTQMQGYSQVPQTFDLQVVAAQVAELLQPDAAKKGVAIVNEVPLKMALYADINMTSLLIRNLVSNAVKYTGSGGQVTVKALPGTNNELQIIVADTGIGIPAQLVAEFNNSTRIQPLDSTPGTANEKGTGLGLMLCKTFAGMMNGKIILASEVGKGSIFTVELPSGKQNS